MKESLIIIAYIAASALFIMSLGGLSRQETARRGKLFGDAGDADRARRDGGAMETAGYIMLAAVLIPGAVIGALVASRVQMTSMPQLVAILHSFVGAAAVLVGFATYLGAASGRGGRSIHSSGGNFYRCLHRLDHFYRLGHRVCQAPGDAYAANLCCFPGGTCLIS